MAPFGDIMADLDKKRHTNPHTENAIDEMLATKHYAAKAQATTSTSKVTATATANQKPRRTSQPWLFEPRKVTPQKVLVKTDLKTGERTTIKVPPKDAKTTETPSKAGERKKLRPVSPSETAVKSKSTLPDKTKARTSQSIAPSTTQKKRRAEDDIEAGPSTMKKAKVGNEQTAVSASAPRDPLRHPKSWKELKDREALRAKGKLPEATGTATNDGPRFGKFESNLERTIAEHLRTQRTAKDKKKRDQAFYELEVLREAGKYDSTGQKAPDGTGKKGWTKKRVNDLMMKLQAEAKGKKPAESDGSSSDGSDMPPSKPTKKAAPVSKKAKMTKEEKKRQELERKKAILRKKRAEREAKYGPITYKGTARPTGDKLPKFLSPYEKIRRSLSNGQGTTPSGSNSRTNSRVNSTSNSGTTSYSTSRRSSSAMNPDWKRENIIARARPNGSTIGGGVYGASRAAPGGNSFWELEEEELQAERFARKEDLEALREEEAHKAVKEKERKEFEQKLLDIKEGLVPLNPT